MGTKSRAGLAAKAICKKIYSSTPGPHAQGLELNREMLGQAPFGGLRSAACTISPHLHSGHQNAESTVGFNLLL